MSKLVKLGFVAALGFGGWYFFTHFRVQGLENVKVAPRGQAASATGPARTHTPFAPQPAKKAIRIAAANFGPLDQAKLAKQHVAGRLVQIVRQFDLLALQDVRARDQSLLVQLLEQVNTGGRHYDFAAAPEVGRERVRQYNAFVFDTDVIEIDRRTVAGVETRSEGFVHVPLVAGFRVRGPSPEEAFTFTLVNVHVAADRTEEELQLLANVFRAVRDDGRNEDDTILLGTIGTDEEHLGPLASLPNATCAILATPTSVRGTQRTDNLLFDRRATSEYTHRSGVVDLMRQFSLSTAEALEMGEHLPVWAEFSAYEGGQAGNVAVAR